MVRSIETLRVAVAVIASLAAVNGQNDTASGPVWNHEDYTTSPPVYPSRKHPIAFAIPFSGYTC